MAADIEWLGHASFRISGGDKTIYIDPYEIGQHDEADAVFVTHAHYDHCSPDDVRELAGPGTVILAPSDCKEKLEGIGGKLISVEPGQQIEAAGLAVRTVPAYNPSKDFHPKANNWVGYIITIGGEKVYHTGDSDLVPEMEGLEADVVLIPVGGTYTMDAEEAAEAFEMMNVKRAIPMHFGTIVGDDAAARRFLDLIGQK